MVVRAGRYYGTPFKGDQGVTQGGPLSPTIFNMMVDAVIFQWVPLVEGEEVGINGFGRAVQWLAAFFHAIERLLDSPRLVRLQADLDVLTFFFDRMVLQTNVKKSWGGV